jgi:flagellar hook-associated protein 3 FlgL
MNNTTVQMNLRRQESKVNTSNRQLGTQQRITQLRDDPIAAGHLVRYQSYLTRVKDFEKNAQTLTDQFSVREGYMNQSLQIMQRVRELAVTGANGTYTSDDLKNMATEVNQLLGALIQNANAVGPDGNALFAGTNTKTTAFAAEMGTVAGSAVPLVENVRYNGTIDKNTVEVDENQYLSVENAGNRTFWAENQQLYSARDAGSWQAAGDSEIAVDGVKIKINTGDNVYALASRINDSGAAVKATIDPVTRGLNIATTDSRQLWLQDVSGTALQDLGLVKDNSQRPPYNIGDAARVSGGSLFDTVIALRNAMLKGDQKTIGGRVLGALDSGIGNLETHIAKTGALYERAQQDIQRNSTTALNTEQLVSREGDLDITEAITNLKMLEYAYQATLSTAGKMYSTSLLDYIR